MDEFMRSRFFQWYHLSTHQGHLEFLTAPAILARIEHHLVHSWPPHPLLYQAEGMVMALMPSIVMAKVDH